MNDVPYFLLLIAAFVIVCYLQRQTYKGLLLSKERKCNQEISAIKANFNHEKYKLNKLVDEIQKESERYVSLHNETMRSVSPFSRVAELFSDWETAIYDETAYFLKHKKHPAVKRAEDVKLLKEKAKEYIRGFKEMRYKYMFLLDAFPELKQYVEDEEALKHLSDYKDYEDFKNERDEVLDYISPEEYKELSENERNQLALDRYKKAKKSNWQIGMQYEMYIGHLLRQNHYEVIQYGIENGLDDLGRDIIARRVEAGIEKTYIIQCKNWAKDKQVHENVVCQIYGTSIQYELANKDLFSEETKVVIPMLVTTNPISDMAKKFADKLGVQCSIRPLRDYPMIKCNINNGKKIYHLPFDQQYYRTQIKLPGECYAMTVEEAAGKGFRRARRHFFEK